MTSRGVLLVRSEGRLLGIPLADVAEVTDLGVVQAVPTTVQAMRGVTTARGRLVPLFHLGALVGGRECPSDAGAGVMVIARVNRRWIALEVDEADAAPREEILAAPMESGAEAWSLGAVRRDNTWVPILNLEALAARWQVLEKVS
ncbi:MAG: chemotaxis protein CheW [Gemmatimonadota bacterium]